MCLVKSAPPMAGFQLRDDVEHVHVRVGAGAPRPAGYRHHGAPVAEPAGVVEHLPDADPIRLGDQGPFRSTATAHPGDVVDAKEKIRSIWAVEFWPWRNASARSAGSSMDGLRSGQMAEVGESYFGSAARCALRTRS